VGANLAHTNFDDATLAGADFNGAVVDGIQLDGSTGRGFVAEQLYATASYNQGNLSRISLAGCELTDWDLADKNVSQGTFSAATLARVGFLNALLKDGDFSEATLSEVDFTVADLTGASFLSTTLTDVDFVGANLPDADLTAADFTNASLENADLEQTVLSAADFTNANLKSADLEQTVLSGANLTGADLTNARLRQATLTDAVFAGAVIHNADFSRTSDHGFVAEQLYATASYQSGDLRELDLSHNQLPGWDFSGKDLSDASFYQAELTDASFAGANLSGISFYNAILAGVDFTDAVIGDCDFYSTTGDGFTAEQLYSTAGYVSGGLNGVRPDIRDLSGWDLAGKDLSDASFGIAAMTGVDLSRSDLRGAIIDEERLDSADAQGAILPDGRIDGLVLRDGQQLVVRDYRHYRSPWRLPRTQPASATIPIGVDSVMTLAPNSSLRVVFKDADFGSHISFQPGIDVSLGGRLELSFHRGAEPWNLVGTTFHVFDWTGANLGGTFGQIASKAELVWDTTGLYTTGEVTLVSMIEQVVSLGDGPWDAPQTWDAEAVTPSEHLHVTVASNELFLTGNGTSRSLEIRDDGRLNLAAHGALTVGDSFTVGHGTLSIGADAHLEVRGNTDLTTGARVVVELADGAKTPLVADGSVSLGENNTTLELQWAGPVGREGTRTRTIVDAPAGIPGRFAESPPVEADESHLGLGVFLRSVDYVASRGQPEKTTSVRASLLVAEGDDANGDGRVDGQDITNLIANFSRPGDPADRNWLRRDTAGGPFGRGDGNVDGQDITALIANFTGDPGPATSGSASAEYNYATNEWKVSVRDVMSWALTSDGRFITAEGVGDHDRLPAGSVGNLVSATSTRSAREASTAG